MHPIKSELNLKLSWAITAGTFYPEDRGGAEEKREKNKLRTEEQRRRREGQRRSRGEGRGKS